MSVNMNGKNAKDEIKAKLEQHKAKLAEQDWEAAFKVGGKVPLEKVKDLIEHAYDVANGSKKKTEMKGEKDGVAPAKKPVIVAGELVAYLVPIIEAIKLSILDAAKTAPSTLENPHKELLYVFANNWDVKEKFTLLRRVRDFIEYMHEMFDPKKLAKITMKTDSRPVLPGAPVRQDTLPTFLQIPEDRISRFVDFGLYPALEKLNLELTSGKLKGQVESKIEGDSFFKNFVGQMKLVAHAIAKLLDEREGDSLKLDELHAFLALHFNNFYSDSKVRREASAVNGKGEHSVVKRVTTAISILGRDISHAKALAKKLREDTEAAQKRAAEAAERERAERERKETEERERAERERKEAEERERAERERKEAEERERAERERKEAEERKRAERERKEAEEHERAEREKEEKDRLEREEAAAAAAKEQAKGLADLKRILDEKLKEEDKTIAEWIEALKAELKAASELYSQMQPAFQAKITEYQGEADKIKTEVEAYVGIDREAVAKKKEILALIESFKDGFRGKEGAESRRWAILLRDFYQQLTAPFTEKYDLPFFEEQVEKQIQDFFVAAMIHHKLDVAKKRLDTIQPLITYLEGLLGQGSKDRPPFALLKQLVDKRIGSNPLSASIESSLAKASRFYGSAKERLDKLKALYKSFLELEAIKKKASLKDKHVRFDDDPAGGDSADSDKDKKKDKEKAKSTKEKKGTHEDSSGIGAVPPIGPSESDKPSKTNQKEIDDLLERAHAISEEATESALIAGQAAEHARKTAERVEGMAEALAASIPAKAGSAPASIVKILLQIAAKAKRLATDAAKNSAAAKEQNQEIQSRIDGISAEKLKEPDYFEEASKIVNAAIPLKDKAKQSKEAACLNNSRVQNLLDMVELINKTLQRGEEVADFIDGPNGINTIKDQIGSDEPDAFEASKAIMKVAEAAKRDLTSLYTKQTAIFTEIVRMIAGVEKPETSQTDIDTALGLANTTFESMGDDIEALRQKQAEAVKLRKEYMEQCKQEALLHMAAIQNASVLFGHAGAAKESAGHARDIAERARATFTGDKMVAMIVAQSGEAKKSAEAAHGTLDGLSLEAPDDAALARNLDAINAAIAGASGPDDGSIDYKALCDKVVTAAEAIRAERGRIIPVLGSEINTRLATGAKARLDAEKARSAAELWFNEAQKLQDSINQLLGKGALKDQVEKDATAAISRVETELAEMDKGIIGEVKLLQEAIDGAVVDPAKLTPSLTSEIKRIEERARYVIEQGVAANEALQQAKLKMVKAEEALAKATSSLGALVNARVGTPLGAEPKEAGDKFDSDLGQLREAIKQIGEQLRLAEDAKKKAADAHQEMLSRCGAAMEGILQQSRLRKDAIARESANKAAAIVAGMAAQEADARGRFTHVPARGYVDGIGFYRGQAAAHAEEVKRAADRVEDAFVVVDPFSDHFGKHRLDIMGDAILEFRRVTDPLYVRHDDDKDPEVIFEEFLDEWTKFEATLEEQNGERKIAEDRLGQATAIATNGTAQFDLANRVHADVEASIARARFAAPPPVVAAPVVHVPQPQAAPQAAQGPRGDYVHQMLLRRGLRQ